MDYEIEEVELDRKIADLQLDLPKGMAFIPENIEHAKEIVQFIFAEPVTQINKVFKNNNLTVEVLGNHLGQLKSRKSADIYLPAIFFGASLLTENPTVLSVALNVLSNYITDFLKGSFGQKTVAIEIYVEKKGKKKIQKISYRGDAEGIKALGDVIEKLD